MRAAILREYGEPLDIHEVPDPEPGPDGAVVRVTTPVASAGATGTRGRATASGPTIASPRTGARPRARRRSGYRRRLRRPVRAGRPRRRSVLARRRHLSALSAGDTGTSVTTGERSASSPRPGAFAERVAVPDADYNLVERPPWLDATAAAALGCRYMTAYHALAERAGLDGGEWLAVHGCGGVGLSRQSNWATRSGARIVAVDVDDDALSLARDLGADETVNPNDLDEETVPDRVRNLTDGGADVSVDALGIAETCRNSVRSVRPRGTHVQVGLTTEAERGEVSSLPTDWMTRWEVSFVGSRGMPPTSYDDLFALVEATDVDPAALVSEELALSEVSERLAAMGEYDARGVEVVTDFGR